MGHVITHLIYGSCLLVAKVNRTVIRLLDVENKNILRIKKTQIQKYIEKVNCIKASVFLKNRH